MGEISEIVDVQITSDIITVAQEGFGVPLILAAYPSPAPIAYLTPTEYTSDVEMVAAGFGTNSTPVKMARALISQSPRVEKFKVALVDPAGFGSPHTYELTVPAAPVTGQIVAVKFYKDGTEYTFSHTVTPGQTQNQVAVALAALIDAHGLFIAPAPGAGVISVTTATNTVAKFLIASLTNVTSKEVTASLAYDTAITNLRVNDDDWYGLAMDEVSEANMSAVMTAIEAAKKIFIGRYPGRPADADAYGDTKQSITRSGFFYIPGGQEMEFPDCALLGRMLPTEPGAETWAFKRLAGCTPVALTSAEKTGLRTAHVLFYETIAGVQITRDGWALSGRYFDITHGVDWLEARIAERIYYLLASRGKLPYTDASVDLVRAEVLAQLRIAIDRNVVKADPEPIVTAPKVANVAPADRAARILPDVKFTCEAAGAIHKVVIRGSLTI